MPRIRFGLTFFITFNIVIIVLVIMGAITMMDLRRERASFAEAQESHGMLIAESLARELPVPLAAKDGKRVSRLTDLIFIGTDAAYVAVFDSGDRAVLSPEEAYAERLTDSDFRLGTTDEREAVSRVSGDLTEFAGPIIDGRTIIGTFQFALSSAQLENELSATLRQRLVQTAAMLVASIIVSYLMSRYFVLPINAMTNALQRLSEGDTSTIGNVNSGRKDEFGDLAEKLKYSIDRIQRGIDRAINDANAGILEDLKEQKDALKREQERHEETELALRQTIEKLEVADQLITELKTANEHLKNESKERKRLEEELRRLEMGSSVSKIVGEIVHDVFNHLTPIMTYAQMSMRDVEIEDHLYSRFEAIGAAAEKSFVLLQRLAASAEPLPVAEIVSPVVNPVSEVQPLFPPPSGGATVLLVDDENDVRGATAEALRQGGYNILEAMEGPEAIQIVEQYTAGKVDVLVTDVIMPGMGGKNLAERITEARPGIRTIYVSGYGEESLLSQGLLDPGAPFVQKPINLATLTNVINDIMLHGAQSLENAQEPV
ncbi:MAG: response regulator [Chloroflexi bacterium]|nr:response regulator [Chloroflexota bacterium]